MRSEPKLHVVDAAAHKEVDLLCGVPLLGGKPTRQLELIVEFGVGALLWVLPFEAATVITLKIYNGADSRFHIYEDAWDLLEK